METLDRTIRYLFILSFVLIVVAYYAGSNKILGTLFSGTSQLGLTFTGRDSSGKFAAYPAGGPTS
jgi:hypothetical protein